MRRIKRLGARFVETVRSPGLYADGGGLWLQVRATGGDGPPDVTRSWIFRFTAPGSRSSGRRRGRVRDMGLGPAHTVGLADVREQAAACRRQLLQGVDPIEARRTAKMQALLAAAATMTFEQCGNAYIAAHEPTWRNPKHRQQWKNTLATYAYPTIGALPVQAIDTGLVVKVIEPIWRSKSETAGRLRGRIENILDWAKVAGYRTGDNPARWRGHLDQLLPRKSKLRKVRHQPAMPYRDVPAFMAELRKQNSASARALEFTILAAVRTSEAIGATWPEIDRQAKVWTIPGRRIKAERDHRVPLPDRAVAILGELPREQGNAHLFPGTKRGKGLSDMAMLELLRGLNGAGYTVHGFRSSFRDWAAEVTNYPRELAEVALAHALKDKTEAAYQRGDLLEKRRRLMRDWAKFCASPPRAEGEVVELRPASA